ncbi:helix-turn-helix domain-containing protein [Flammeovirga kamogawensis]|nr:helix-turn-helix domain-containing protein [Flammeovirga kamogawensis]
MNLKNLPHFKRKLLQRYIELKKYSVAWIAKYLEVSPSTIYRELKRNTNPHTERYDADYAHKLYRARKKYAGSRKKNPFRIHPLRTTKYKLHDERRLIYWYSDQYYFRLNLRKWKFSTSGYKIYAERLGIKKFHYLNNWEYYDLLLEHLKFFIKFKSSTLPKYYWMRRLIKKEAALEVWKNPVPQMQQKKCV